MQQIDHVNQRVQFGKKLRDFGRVKEILTDMIVRHYVAESITYRWERNWDLLCNLMDSLTDIRKLLLHSSLASNMDRGVMEYQACLEGK
jgi:alkylation response protein AidB-like acyl-CoA dehydrogenase